MNLYQKLTLCVIFLLIGSVTIILSHEVGMLALLILPLVAIINTLIVKAMIQEIFAEQNHHF